MSSMKAAPHTAPETAERIRDVAITEFAAAGVAKTTVRQIASAAGVSPGLVIHHFGSKAGLRASCDNYVFEQLTEVKSRNSDGTATEMTGHIFGDSHMSELVGYLVKSMLDPSDQGQRYFDYLVETAERVVSEGFAGYSIREFSDKRAQAATIAMLSLAPMLLEARLRSTLGTESLHETMTRVVPYLFELYQHGFIDAVPEGQGSHDPKSAPGSQHDPPHSGPSKSAPH